MTQILVTMPTFNTPRELLERSVASILNQTHRDLRLVVVSDGPRLRDLPGDDRLIVYRIPDNRGRYFCDAVTTACARDDEVVVIHDADDWSEPDRFELLLPTMRDGAAIARYYRHMRKGVHIQTPSRKRFDSPDGSWVHIGHWCSGAYTGERIRRAGGVHPGFRVGYDTLFVRMIALTGKVGISNHAAYHWCRREDGESLTLSTETKFGSPLREAAKRQLADLNSQAWAARAEDPGQVIRDSIPRQLADEVAYHASILATKL